MTALGGRAFAKGGAEGVCCPDFPELGLGAAIKCQDGAVRAAEIAMAAIIAGFLPLNNRERDALAPLREPDILNWNGEIVGRIGAASALAAMAPTRLAID